MHYFAYGSNLLNARLQRRVPSASLVGVGTVSGFALRFHMAGGDGSAKCDAAVSDSNAHVWGAVYRIDREHKPTLDAAESLGKGYEIMQVRVNSVHGDWEAFMYRAQTGWINSALKPFFWYKHFVLAGARQKQLPEAYVAAIAAVPAITDTDRARAEFNHRILASDDGPELIK